MRILVLALVLFTSQVYAEAFGRVDKPWDDSREFLYMELNIPRQHVGQIGAMYIALTIHDQISAFRLEHESREHWVPFNGGLALEYRPIGPLPARIKLVAASGYPSICHEYQLNGPIQVWAGYGLLDEMGQRALQQRTLVKSPIPEDYVLRSAVQNNLVRNNTKWLIYQTYCTPWTGG